MKLYRTNHEEKKYLLEDAILTGDYDCMKALNIYPEKKYQTWQGFGGAFTEAAAVSFEKLSKENQDKFIEEYFGEDGIGYTFCRVHINSCDFALGNYACLEKEPDENWSDFNIDRDKKSIIPLIKRAMEANKDEMNFLASPWSPPAFMKTNGEMNHGGKLKAEYAGMWAKFYVKFIKAYEAEGIKISHITVQNEPLAVQTWDSCIYTDKEEGDFVRDYLAPTLKEEGLGHIKLLVWDHNKEYAYERAKGVMYEKEIRDVVDGVAFHWYTGDHFENLDLVHEEFPEKELIFTEGCVEYSRFEDSNEVYKAQMYAHDIIGNLNHGTNASIDWNILLDEIGGPNHVGNYCAAPVMMDTKTGEYEKRLSFTYIGHFSKFIRPGAKRIAHSRYTSKLEVTAWENIDKSKVIVIMNPTDADVETSVKCEEDIANITVKAHEIVTIVL